MNISRKRARSRLPLLLLTLLLVLTGCQKTTQFTYEGTDYFAETEIVMNGLGVNYEPAVEKTVVVAAAFNTQGIGYLQEHQLHDFSTITINTVPGGRVVVSVPYNETEPYRWRLVLNESRTQSRPFRPAVAAPRPDRVYDRLNFLLEPEFDSDITFVLEDGSGNRKLTFLASIRGITP